jgi:hypothetical protein
MRIARIIVLITAPILFGQSASIHVRELPPELIPHGTCTQGHSGYLGVEELERNRFTLSDNEIGEYVRLQMCQGYSLSLYPQASGRIFAVAQCEFDSASVSRQSR